MIAISIIDDNSVYDTVLLPQKGPTGPALQLIVNCLAHREWRLLIYHSTVNILGLLWLQEWEKALRHSLLKFFSLPQSEPIQTLEGTCLWPQVQVWWGPHPMAIKRMSKFCGGGHRPKKFTWNFPSYSWAKFLCEATPGKIGKLPLERKVWRRRPCPISWASIPHTSAL